LIELLNVDCMAYMATLPDKAFDLALVDPPYGLNIDGQKETANKERNPQQNRKAHIQKSWDSAIPNAKYFRELERVSEHQIIWGANYFVEHLQRGTKGWIFWFKGQVGLTMSDGELAYSSFDKATRMCTFNRVELLKEGTIHPTQKPIRLYEWLLTNYAKPGQRILDTHLGSGSSAIAAKNFGVDFVGCELDKDYYDAAVLRFNNANTQDSLFAPSQKPEQDILSYE
jgi:site-specific DNA-methyltransferase (adenine-specific)